MTMRSEKMNIINCAQVTVEYDTIKGQDVILVVPFPNVDLIQTMAEQLLCRDHILIFAQYWMGVQVYLTLSKGTNSRIDKFTIRELSNY